MIHRLPDENNAPSLLLVSLRTECVSGGREGVREGGGIVIRTQVTCSYKTYHIESRVSGCSLKSQVQMV